MITVEREHDFVNENAEIGCDQQPGDNCGAAARGIVPKRKHAPEGENLPTHVKATIGPAENQLGLAVRRAIVFFKAMHFPLRSLPHLLCGVLFAFALTASLTAADRVRVTLLCTTDMHAHIYPVDYYTNKPAENGLAKLATLIKQARKETPSLLLIDTGDTIQGTPLAYYHNRKNNTPVDPMMLVMNSLHYDCMTLGNHEYNFGLPVLEKARHEANFPWISANIYKAGTNEPAYTPYIVKEISGVRIGILGLTTPGIPHWEDPENYAGHEFRETVAEARKWVALLREREHVDGVVIAMHMGLEEDPIEGRRNVGAVENENAALAIARTVPGVDFIALAHTHRDFPALVVNGVLLAQAGRWGDHLVKADLFFAKDASGRWAITSKASGSIPVRSEVAADPDVLALTESYHQETQAWLNRQIGTSERAIDGADGYIRDTALIDLIQQVQLEAGVADVSFAANFNPRARIAAGPVTVREIASLYTYENTLYVIEATGAQIKAALEHSARFFLPYESGKTPAELIDRSVPGYNFDLAEGVAYEIDLARPIGDRIRNLTFQGAPLAPDRKLRVSLNNYRYNGGGGYAMFAGAPIVARPSGEIRDLIIDWVERHHTIPPEPTGNWRIVP